MDQLKSRFYVPCLDDNCIDVFALNLANGSLEKLQTVPLSGRGLPVAVSPDRKRLYASVLGDVVDGREQAWYETFCISPGDGRLERINVINAPARMAHISVDKTGRYLLGASYRGNFIVSHALGDKGIPQPAFADYRDAPGKPHQLMTDPSNRFALAPNLGADLVMMLTFDERTGQFRHNTPNCVTTHDGAGPRHVAYHPTGNAVYLINELDGTLIVYTYDMRNGQMVRMQETSVVPDDHEGPAWSAQILVTPDGRHLYVTDRNAHSITGFAIDPRTCRLSKRRIMATEETPRGFDIDTTGRWLVVGGKTSNHLTSYGIDPVDGSLSEACRVPCSAGPNWVEALEL
nr:beta-propeller fold lactonase family protein [Oceaniglobus trochenteri]